MEVYVQYATFRYFVPVVKIIDRNQHVINIYRVVDVSRYVDLVSCLL